MTNSEYRQRWVIAAQFLAVIVFCAGVVPVALWVGQRITSVLTPTPSETTHSDFVSILLTGLTVSIAVLALVIAGLAIWGYHAIKLEARKIAIKAARASATKTVNSVAMQDVLRKEARIIIEAEFIKWTESQELSEAQPPQPDTLIAERTVKERVGKPLRRRGDIGGNSNK